ncbi:MAG: C1 family peptidase [bacterium]
MIKKRLIEMSVKKNYTYLKTKFALIKKAKIKSYTGIFIIAFLAGIAVAMIWTISNNFHPFSSAAISSSYIVKINKSFIKNETITPFSSKTGKIYGLNINIENLKLNNATSSIRVILVDNKSNEYLVYEAYPLITDNNLAVSNACAETCDLNGITPTNLKIQIIDASLKIKNISIIMTQKKIRNRSEINKVEQTKIKKMNAQIKKTGKKWIAGETSISKLSYAEKKKLFVKEDGAPMDELPNLQGFEYYKGGIFEIDSKVKTAKTGAVKSASVSVTSAKECTDSDGGENYYTKGTLNSTRGRAFTDICIDNDSIREYWCTEGREFSSVTTSTMCFNGCKDGACIFECKIDRIIGDADGNGYLTETDAELVSMIDAGLISPQNNICCLDADRNGKVDILDALAIAEIAAGTRTSSGVWNGNCDITISNLPEKWDWRSVNGENWMTPVKNQGSAGTCWAHATMGALESQINLYYNQHLNIDLSEQMLADCKNYPQIEELKLPEECEGCDGDKYCRIMHLGIADELCDPYAERNFSFTIEDSKCDYAHICSDWKDRVWKNSDFHVYAVGRGMSDCEKYSIKKYSINLSEAEFKRVLIERGPMNSAYHIWNHAMVLAGYENDVINKKTVWIFKNSWGDDWGENGYAKISAPLSWKYIPYGSLPLGPFIPPKGQSYEIACVDKDYDDYCNWGISENKPSSCPMFCKPEKDCDDSNSELGAFDENYNCRVFKKTINMECKSGQKIGDVNGDGQITNQDADLAAKIDSKLLSAPENICCLDVDQDKEFSIFDALEIAEIAQGNKMSRGICE